MEATTSVTEKDFATIVDEYVQNEQSKFQLQYVDYDASVWTMPCLLTPQRAERFKKDASVKKVRIIYRNEIFEIAP